MQTTCQLSLGAEGAHGGCGRQALWEEAMGCSLIPTGEYVSFEGIFSLGLFFLILIISVHNHYSIAGSRQNVQFHILLFATSFLWLHSSP